MVQLTLSHLICWAVLWCRTAPILPRKSCLPWWRLKPRSQYNVWGFLQKVILCTSSIQHIYFLTCTQNMRHNHRTRKTVLNKIEYLPKWNLIALKNKTKKCCLDFHSFPSPWELSHYTATYPKCSSWYMVQRGSGKWGWNSVQIIFATLYCFENAIMLRSKVHSVTILFYENKTMLPICLLLYKKLTESSEMKE